MTLNPSLLTSATPEWYTPADLAAAIAAFLGGIDLDPCADPAHRIPAARHFDGVNADGLREPWGATARVFVNPPYGRAIGPWIEKALSEPLAELVLLVPARTDTTWFQPLWRHHVCFLRGRLRFSGHASGAPFPSALCYRGTRGVAFAAAFAHLGVTVRSIH